jgi:crossover junction endodeoxyribonuclease RusA
MRRERMKLIIPEIPPSNNKYMGRGTVKGQAFAYQNEKQRWEWLVKAAVKKKPKKPLKKARVQITYFFPDRRRRDPDNYSGKFLLDGLTRAGIIEDDSFSNIQLELRGECDRKNPRTEIELEELRDDSG